MDNVPLMEVVKLSKRYEDTVAVQDVSFRVFRGESVGIVGESGCGKSTTARLISGLESPTAGQVLFEGKPHVLKPGRGLCRVNMVFQNPVASFDRRMTVFESLYEALSHTESITRAAARPVIADMLRTVELPDSYIDRRASQLSGGECQRVGIARALLTRPELLICDEATSALDVSVQAQIIHLLKRIKDEQNLTYLFISHDLGLVAGLCDRVIVMYMGRVVEQGTVLQVMASPVHPYTKLLLSSADAFALDDDGRASVLPSIPQRLTDRDGACSFYAFCDKRSDRCLQERPELCDCGDGHLAACHGIDRR